MPVDPPSHSVSMSTAQTTTSVSAPSTSSNYSVPSSATAPLLLASEGAKLPTEGCRKRPATSLAISRANKNLGTSTDPSSVDGLSPREQRALRRKEKSRLAAKLRRNQESDILSCLLRALPVSLENSQQATTEIKSVSSNSNGLNLEKSGVIRMAGQTLFLYNSLAHVLGNKEVPLISLLSKSLYGLLVHPTDSTVVYATPPLAEALNWPWINLIGINLQSLTDDGKLPTASGQTVCLRLLEQPSSPTKSSFLSTNRPATPLSPSHSPSSSPFSPTPPSDQTSSPLWSPHLYRSSKSGGGGCGSQPQGVSSGGKAVSHLVRQLLLCEDPMLTNFVDSRCVCTEVISHQLTSHDPAAHALPTQRLQLHTATTGDKARSRSQKRALHATTLNQLGYPTRRPVVLLFHTLKFDLIKNTSFQICSCFAILKVPISSPGEPRLPPTSSCLLDAPSDANSTASVSHLLLYLLQPTPNIAIGRENVECSAKISPVLPSASFHRNKERYFLNRQRRLLLQSPPQPTNGGRSGCQRDFFVTILDRVLSVKWVENGDASKTCNFASMIGHSYLDFIAIQDLPKVSSLLTECLQRKSPVWTSAYRLRLPVSSSTGTTVSYSQSKFVWVRSLFSTSNAFGATIRCLHQPIGDVQSHGVEAYLQTKPHSNFTSLSQFAREEPRHLIGNSRQRLLASHPTTANLPVKRPIRVLKIQPYFQPHHQEMKPQQQNKQVTTLTSMSANLTVNTGPYLTPLAAASSRDTSVVYETTTALTPQPLVPTPWLVYTRSLSAPQPTLAKSPAPLVQTRSLNVFLAGDLNEVSDLPPMQRCPSPARSPVESQQIDKLPDSPSDISLNLPDMLQELGPETLAMLEENDDAKSDSLLTNLSFDDILSSISISTKASDCHHDKHSLTPLTGSLSSTDSSPPSLPESFASSYSCSTTYSSNLASKISQQLQIQSQQLQREPSLFNDMELDSDLPSDTDEFWDALVSNVMNLPLDTTNLPMDVR
ncbi:unnamed protein product [Mesocestoides corti]|uniref:Uncharacterized protein n=1 Tax=Mesocestoides corti TaxID=53468 RepID=A0A3P6HMB2_MESCO|nr:unnamed protein product [Mesocestoides corti]